MQGFGSPIGIRKTWGSYNIPILFRINIRHWPYGDPITGGQASQDSSVAQKLVNKKESYKKGGIIISWDPATCEQSGQTW